MFQADYFFMSQALMLAKRGYLTVSPNPMVGCVIVKNGEIVGEGWHRFAGDKHAEIYALEQAGEKAKDATVYVTLEPCCHVGRTGACTENLIQAQVAKVIVASVDPNPKVNGKGIQRLKDAGIRIQLGLMQHAAIKLNKIFFHYQQHKLPYVIAKWAMSLDGETKTHHKDSKAITNQASQREVHNLRNQVDAIIIGRNTVIEDNPKLTVRISDAQLIKNPLRVVLSKTANLPLHAHIFSDQEAKTVIFTSALADKNAVDVLKGKGIECIDVQLNKDGELDLDEVLQVLARREISSILVEGGKTLLNAFFSANLVNEVQSYIAPVIIGGLQAKKVVKVKENGFFQEDYYCMATVR